MITILSISCTTKYYVVPVTAVPTAWGSPDYGALDLSTFEGVKGLLDNFNRCDEMRDGLIQIIDALGEKPPQPSKKLPKRNDGSEDVPSLGGTGGVGGEFY